MQRFSGALMVLAGVALGGYSILPTFENTADTLAEVTRIAAAPDRTTTSSAPSTTNAAQTAARDNSGVRVFSPATPLVMPEPGTNSGTTTTWTAVVTTERSAATQLKSPKPGDAEARWHLASDLQRELKRVGCYGGEINGAWTQSTRRAMSLFMERVNATLPADEPDYILLTLVQNHTALACGTDCPAGEVVSDTGRCLPSAVVAQANRRAQRLEERQAERRLAEQRKAEQQELLAAEQRATERRRVVIAQRAEAQRLEAQRVERQRVAKNAVAPDAPQTTASIARDGQTPPKNAHAATVNTERLPWLDDPSITRHAEQAPQVAVAETAQRSTPLPGMMSVGGPRGGTPADVPASATVGVTGRAAIPALSPDRIDRDNLSDAASPAIVAPAPRPANRPQYASHDPELAVGLPGSKAGPTARSVDLYGPGPSAALRKYSRTKVVRRSPSSYGAPRAKKYYAYNSVGKTRRGQPRPGSPRYNLLLSLGGLY